MIRGWTGVHGPLRLEICATFHLIGKCLLERMPRLLHFRVNGSLLHRWPAASKKSQE